MLLQNWNAAFLNFFIRYRIGGTCFFEGFPYRDQGMYVYLDNYKVLLRKRIHFCLLEQTGLVKFGGKGRMEGRKGEKEILSPTLSVFPIALISSH